MSKGEITSKPIYKSAIEALLDDYSSNQNMYQLLFNEPKGERSMPHHFLEGIYAKYASSLEKYMKENKANMRLSGNKKYDNVPIDFFIKESQVYKEALLSELHNKYHKDNDNDNDKASSLDHFFLTPLPNKPRVLLTTQQEKDEFIIAERQAVVMRTVEYTNALRNQGNQYYMMKNDERQQMIYIFKRATHIIQDWWKTKGREGQLRRRKKAKDYKAKRLRKASAVRTINDVLIDIIRPIEDRLLTQMKRKRRKKENETRHVCSFAIMPSYYRKKCNFGGKWEYISKQKRLLSEYTETRIRGCLNPMEPIKLLQMSIKAFLRSLNKNKLLFNDKKTQFGYLVTIKEMYNKRKLTKALLKWLRLLYSPTESQKCLNLKLKQLSPRLEDIGYVTLAKTIVKAFNRRLLPLLVNMRYAQAKSKGFNQLASLLQKKTRSLGMKIIRFNIINSLLNKILIKRHWLNQLWKHFSIWNILNIVVHLFVNKLNDTFSKAHKRNGIATLYNNSSHCVPSEYTAEFQAKSSALIKKIRYSSIKDLCPMLHINLFAAYKGLECLSLIRLKLSFNKLKENAGCSKASIEEEGAGDCDVIRPMTYDNTKISDSFKYADDDDLIKIHHPTLTQFNLNKGEVIDNIPPNKLEGGSNNIIMGKKSRVVIKAVKAFESMDKIDNDSDIELFKLKQLKEKERENIINFSRFTNKILTDSSGMKADSSISHYNNPYKGGSRYNNAYKN